VNPGGSTSDASKQPRPLAEPSASRKPRPNDGARFDQISLDDELTTSIVFGEGSGDGRGEDDNG
jgi:hypothetical protein